MKFNYYVSEDAETLKTIKESIEKKPALNNMCLDCVKLNNICKGSYNNIYSGCIYKRKKYA